MNMFLCVRQGSLSRVLLFVRIYAIIIMDKFETKEVNHMIYLDNAATTKPCREAVEAAAEAMNIGYGNPSSRHSLGIEAEKIVSSARAEIARSLGCEDNCIVFTSGATESNNTAIFGGAQRRIKRKPRVVTTTVEHPSVKEAFDRLERDGAEVVRIAPDENGEITAETIINAVDERTCLISCMLVNNETGYTLPIAKAFSAIKRKYPDCVTHCDAVQGYMKTPIRVSALCADLISISGHKVYAPKGIGALYIKKGFSLPAYLLGGGQERGQRSGTENVPAIAGFGAAVKLLSKTVEERARCANELRDLLYNSIAQIEGVTVNSKPTASPYICSIAMKGYKSETLLNFLSEKGIAVSSGSACSKGKKSSVLKAFGIPDAVADSTLRISFSHETVGDDIKAFCEALVQARGLAHN